MLGISLTLLQYALLSLGGPTVESFVEYIMASCAVVAYARMLYEATVTLLYITLLQDDNRASISSLSFYRPNAFLIFDQLCLQCFDTVGWAAGRASSL